MGRDHLAQIAAICPRPASRKTARLLCDYTAALGHAHAPEPKSSNVNCFDNVSAIQFIPWLNLLLFTLRFKCTYYLSSNTAALRTDTAPEFDTIFLSYVKKKGFQMSLSSSSRTGILAAVIIGGSVSREAIIPRTMSVDAISVLFETGGSISEEKRKEPKVSIDRKTAPTRAQKEEVEPHLISPRPWLCRLLELLSCLTGQLRDHYVKYSKFIPLTSTTLKVYKAKGEGILGLYLDKFEAWLTAALEDAATSGQVAHDEEQTERDGKT
ncbi:hypothetical protein EVAR_49133_1 [Eumeta japonica]|uniref:Uncharacterized protein n=1 Tax=Eumeta variegata TaxID=151549 RepID=A0A4C1YPN4_EUMVA|nr:hypothetical protein EVAR_49133_1 [Eumeta japonica]